MKSVLPTKNSYKKFDRKNYQKVWYTKNKEEHNKASKKWYELHKEERKKYYLENIDHRKILDKKRYDEKREIILIQKKIYYAKNKEKLLHRHKEWCKRNKGIVSIKHKEYYQKNKEEVKNRNKIYHKKMVKINTLYRLRTNSRRRINLYFKLKDLTKNYKYSEYIGCLPSELKIYLERMFTSGMSWSNYGSWHVDHIIPLSSAKTEEEVYKLCHYTNLQPLWAKDNLIKGNKLN